MILLPPFIVKSHFLFSEEQTENREDPEDLPVVCTNWFILWLKVIFLSLYMLSKLAVVCCDTFSPHAAWQPVQDQSQG